MLSMGLSQSSLRTSWIITTISITRLMWTTSTIFWLKRKKLRLLGITSRSLPWLTVLHSMEEVFTTTHSSGSLLPQLLRTVAKSLLLILHLERQSTANGDLSRISRLISMLRLQPSKDLDGDGSSTTNSQRLSVIWQQLTKNLWPRFLMFHHF